jgi:hypothetical protein
MQVELMVDPVVAMDGHTYERENILRHFEAERERWAGIVKSIGIKAE